MSEEHGFSNPKGGLAAPPLPAKTRITIRIDNDVLTWFRAQAQDGGSYQALINRALREYIGRQGPLEEILRRVIREELQRAK